MPVRQRHAPSHVFLFLCTCVAAIAVGNPLFNIIASLRIIIDMRMCREGTACSAAAVVVDRRAPGRPLPAHPMAQAGQLNFQFRISA